MKALTFLALETVSYETIDDPRIEDDDDVIVRVKQCAICGSDLHVYHGREKGIDQFTAMGHEFIGEIVETGKRVRHLRKGDMVMSPFTISCGECYFCKIGLTCRCIHSQLFGWREGFQGLHGGQSELVRVPKADGTLVKIPEGVSDDDALFLGDILSTGFYCAKQAEINKGGTHAVIGCGPVGLMAIAGAIHYGSEKVYAFDNVPERLQMAENFGAIPVNGLKNDPVAVIKEATAGRGADAVMEAVGTSGAGRLAYDLLRPGGIISVVGVCNDPNMAFSPEQAYNKNITYKVGRCPARAMIDELLPMVKAEKINFSSIITHRMKLSEGVRGYDIFANRADNCLKVVLTP
jgi:threonine dehydrogenase-like Zn-dependent dehydrogenase